MYLLKYRASWIGIRIFSSPENERGSLLGEGNKNPQDAPNEQENILESKNRAASIRKTGEEYHIRNDMPEALEILIANGLADPDTKFWLKDEEFQKRLKKWDQVLSSGIHENNDYMPLFMWAPDTSRALIEKYDVQFQSDPTLIELNKKVQDLTWEQRKYNESDIRYNQIHIDYTLAQEELNLKISNLLAESRSSMIQSVTKLIEELGNLPLDPNDALLLKNMMSLSGEERLTNSATHLQLLMWSSSLEVSKKAQQIYKIFADIKDINLNIKESRNTHTERSKDRNIDQAQEETKISEKLKNEPHAQEIQSALSEFISSDNSSDNEPYPRALTRLGISFPDDDVIVTSRQFNEYIDLYAKTATPNEREVLEVLKTRANQYETTETLEANTQLAKAREQWLYDGVIKGFDSVVQRSEKLQTTQTNEVLNSQWSSISETLVYSLVTDLSTTESKPVLTPSGKVIQAHLDNKWNVIVQDPTLTTPDGSLNLGKQQEFAENSKILEMGMKNPILQNFFTDWSLDLVIKHMNHIENTLQRQDLSIEQYTTYLLSYILELSGVDTEKVFSPGFDATTLPHLEQYFLEHKREIDTGLLQSGLATPERWLMPMLFLKKLPA